MVTKGSVAGVILNGGKSTRMGQDKSTLVYANNTLLEHSRQLFIDAGIKNIYVSGEQGIKDQISNKGPLAGILASLEYLHNYDFVLFIPIDMPLLNKKIICELQTQKMASLVHFDGNNLPLILENNEHIRNLIKQQIQSGALSLYQLFKAIKATCIINNHQKKLFTNTNSPKEWQEAIHLLQELKP